MKPAGCLALFFLFALPSVSVAGTKCEERTVAGHRAKICMVNPGMFGHWTFSLEVDGEAIFALISPQGSEIARQCDFMWGGIKIIDAVRFVH